MASDENIYGQLAEFDYNPFGFNILRYGDILANTTGWYRIQPLNNNVPVVLSSSTEVYLNTAFSAVTMTNTVFGKFTLLALSGNSGPLIAYRLGT